MRCRPDQTINRKLGLRLPECRWRCYWRFATSVAERARTRATSRSGAAEFAGLNVQVANPNIYAPIYGGLAEGMSNTRGSGSWSMRVAADVGPQTNPVPEPASWALTLVGLVLLTRQRRSRQAAKQARMAAVGTGLL